MIWMVTRNSQRPFHVRPDLYHPHNEVINSVYPASEGIHAHNKSRRTVIMPLTVERALSLNIQAGHTDNQERLVCFWIISTRLSEAIASVACAPLVSGKNDTKTQPSV